MFRFESPEYLYFLCLIPLLAVLHYWSLWRRRKRLRAYGDIKLLKGLMQDVSKWRGEVKVWLALAALACIIIATARPQFGTKVDTNERYGIEAMIAIDVSNSMLATDVSPSRLDKAKMLFSNMVDKMQNDKVGVVVFAGDAFVQLPITNDYVSAKMFLDQINPSMIRVQGTDMGLAIDLCVKSFTTKEGVSRAIFLITDGEDNEEGAVRAAQIAAKKGIHVYVLGIGSPEGAHVPIPGTNQYIIDEQGEPVVTKLNEQMCRQIAEEGKGAYIYVNNSSAAQEQLASHVDRLGKTSMESTVYSEYDEQFQGFLILALVFLLVDLFIMERENHFWKRWHLFKRLGMLALLMTLGLTASAQNARDYVRKGNRFFRDSVYDKAQVQYQKAYERDSASTHVLYNLSNAMLRNNGELKETVRLLEKAGKTEKNPQRRAMIYHNLGVIMQSQQMFKEAIECYKESLRNNPKDHETRYNYVLCQRQLKDDENNGGGGGGNDKDDQGDNQDQKDDEKQGQQDKQDQQNQQQDQQNQQDQQQQQQQDQQMKQENAEQILKAALQKERATQDKVNKQQQQSQQRRLQKQW